MNGPAARSWLQQISACLYCCVWSTLVHATEPSRQFDVYPDKIQLHSRDETVQLIVSQVDATGLRHQHNAQSQFDSLTPSIVSVDSSGLVTPLTNGPGKIQVRLGDSTRTISVETSVANSTSAPDFDTEVQAVLAAHGCSAGACHGKQGGQNGFQLSLLGFDSDFDYASITQFARGRRVSPTKPRQSLLLQKPTGRLPHGGGTVLDSEDVEYSMLLRWIELGTPRESLNASPLVKIELQPGTLVMPMSSTHGLKAVATFADGSRRDVTRYTSFQSNEAAIASVVANGEVTAADFAGEAAIMGRFLNAIATCRVLIPRRETMAEQRYSDLPRRNLIDELVWNKLRELRMLPSESCSDSKFLRRAFIDIVGRLPPAEKAREFLKDQSADKRTQLIDHLLHHPGFADHWANKWVDLLRPNPYRVGIKAVLNYDYWIRQSFRDEKPFDEFARQLVTARGSTWQNGAVTLFRDRRSPDEVATLMSQLFLGVRLECAKCHHHPFEVWSQDDFYQFAAFFSRVGRKGTGLSPPISGGEETILVAESGSVKHPRTGEIQSPCVLHGEPITVDNQTDPRVVLAEWITSDDNPFFARAIANRVWADLMGRGIVEPVDDLRATNPPSNEPLLQALAERFIASDYDLKELIRLIANSHVYGLSSLPNETNVSDHINYSRHYRRRLRAEVLLDGIGDITGVPDTFAAMAPGSRANEIWTHRIGSTFLDTFGRPDPNQDPPCERLESTAVVQALHLMNSPQLFEKITSDKGRVAELAASDASITDIIQQLYLLVYSRFPDASELESGKRWFAAESRSRRESTEDLMWALMNTAEFVFND